MIKIDWLPVILLRSSNFCAEIVTFSWICSKNALDIRLGRFQRSKDQVYVRRFRYLSKLATSNFDVENYVWNDSKHCTKPNYSEIQINSSTREDLAFKCVTIYQNCVWNDSKHCTTSDEYFDQQLETSSQVWTFKRGERFLKTISNAAVDLHFRIQRLDRNFRAPSKNPGSTSFRTSAALSRIYFVRPNPVRALTPTGAFIKPGDSQFSRKHWRKAQLIDGAWGIRYRALEPAGRPQWKIQREFFSLCLVE